uniref:WW domain-containing protein n=1 Tax=Angiostrongylus cantonensis TaxID=6313 RepID=A0A158PCD8_ANGCA
MPVEGHLYGTPRPEECYEEATMVNYGHKGPLPPNWEIGYAENGDKYFIESVIYHITSNGHHPSPQHQQRSRPPTIPSTAHLNGDNPYFTRDPQQLRGEMVTTTIVKGPKGLGFTLIGNDASSKGNEFIQACSLHLSSWFTTLKLEFRFLSAIDYCKCFFPKPQ